MSKKKFEDLIEVRGRVMATKLSPSNLEMTKLEFVDEENFEILAINNLIDTDWRKPIMDYLENPTTSSEGKIRYHALSYTLMGNKLFKKIPEGILLKCLSESEEYLALLNVHSGECSAHQIGHKIK